MISCFQYVTAGLTSDGQDMWWFLQHKALLFCYQKIKHIYSLDRKLLTFYTMRFWHFSESIYDKNKLVYFSYRAGNDWKLQETTK